MKLSNTLTNSLTDLGELGITPGGRVTVYSCGPTVYNHVHIGNLRTFIMDDLLRRTLVSAGYRPKAVMNITDVDDKTIATSRAEHPNLGPMEALIETTRAYEAVFLADLSAVGVDTSLFKTVRATEQIPAMQAMIRRIFDRGLAYVAEGSVYFDLGKYQAAGNTYGRLVNVDFSPQARIDNDDYDKHEARDFALWKAASDDEPFWDFSLGEHDLPGRPGWHIECSAMALDNLGEQPITIHSGGIDLKFPHHENEIAQVTAATGADFTRIFTHHNHLFVDGRKMSKSLNNFFTLGDITAKGYHPLAFRLLCLQAAHTSELNFTWDSLEAAQNLLGNLYAWADLLHQTQADTVASDRDITSPLARDLDSTSALAALASATDQPPTAELLGALDRVLGLGLSGRPDIDDATKQLITQREAARAAKDWATSDQLRAQLAERGIEIDDTAAGSRWRRTTLTTDISQ